MKRLKSFPFGLASALKLALPLLLIFQIAMPGAALCIEPGGMATVEEYANGLCGESFEESREESIHSLECAHESHCGECIDIPLPEASSGKSALGQSDADGALLSHALAVTVMPVHPRPLSLYHRSQFPSEAHHEILPLLVKTTVLVC